MFSNLAIKKDKNILEERTWCCMCVWMLYWSDNQIAKLWHLNQTLFLRNMLMHMYTSVAA